MAWSPSCERGQKGARSAAPQALVRRSEAESERKYNMVWLTPATANRARPEGGAKRRAAGAREAERSGVRTKYNMVWLTPATANRARPEGGAKRRAAGAREA